MSQILNILFCLHRLHNKKFDSGWWRLLAVYQNLLKVDKIIEETQFILIFMLTSTFSYDL